MIERIDELRLFAHLAETGSLTGAARILGLPLNTASRRLASLEERLGVRLAQRTTRSLALTDEGERFLPRCLAILDAVADAEAELSASGEALRGTLRLGVPTRVARMGLLEALRDVLEREPALRCQLRVSDEPLDPVKEGLDMVVRVGPLEDRALLAAKLGRVSGRLAAAPAYLDAHGAPRVPQDLRRHRVLGFFADRRQRAWTLVDGAGRELTVPVEPALESDDSRVLADALDAGIGVGVVVGAVPPSLVPVLPSYRFEALPVHALYAASRRRSPRVRLLVDLLRALFAAPES